MKKHIPDTKTTAGFTRRHFIRTAALAAGAVVCSPYISRSWAAAARESRYRNLVPPSRPVRVGCVGIAGRGGKNIPGLVGAGAEIVALCDVDLVRAGTSFYNFPQVPRYRDYRQMLDEMDGEIDAVMIATPDHMHFPVALMAIERGKHVYVEKPLTHTISEARILNAAALKHGVATQMGNQGHANEGTRLTREWIEAGVIGAVREVHCWSDRPIWPQGISWPEIEGDSTVAPATLDWNLWLGVAPLREYRPNIAPSKWRGFWEYGCGALGDMGCHVMDAAFWALDLRGPCKVTVVEAGPATLVSPPKSAVIKYEFPARGPLPPLTFTWHDGGKTPPKPAELGADGEISKAGTLYYGDKGIMYSNNGYSTSVRLLPEARMREFTARPPHSIPRVGKGGQYKEWLDACRGIGDPGSNIVDHSADLTEFVLLGNLALRAGKPIDWDAAAGLCTGNPEASAYINKHYRIY